MGTFKMDSKLRAFYDREYLDERYGKAQRPEDHSIYNELRSFIDTYQLHEKRCLEIGCGRGAFQDLVTDYTGVDLSGSVRNYFRKPFCQATAINLPFGDNTFDAIWSYVVLEHVPKPEEALAEMRRVLIDNGLLFLAPAWQCRTWAAKGYPVRPYRDFDLRGKLVKASIPIRNSVLFRSTYIFPKRLVSSIEFLFTKEPTRFKYKELTPNYDHFWMSDSDAVSAMDPYETILWFVSRGDICISHKNWIAKFFVRTGAVIFRIQKSRKRH